MQVIQSELFTILVPDKGYKIVNKNTGKYHKKVYLGKLDSIDNYGEVVDDKYINMDYVVEMDDMKNKVIDYNKQNDEIIDLLLYTINDLYVSFEPLLSIIPMSLNEDEPKKLNFGDLYLLMLKRGLIDKDEIPEKFKEYVDGKIM